MLLGLYFVFIPFEGRKDRKKRGRKGRRKEGRRKGGRKMGRERR